MSERVGELTAFPKDGRRVIFYLYYDPRDVDDYISTSSSGFGRSPSTSSSSSTASSPTRAGAGSSRSPTPCGQRENVGFDVWGYKRPSSTSARERLAEYDELILMNYTWFGPVDPFEPVFERMSALKVDFWGMTEHGEEIPNPFTLKGSAASPHPVALDRRAARACSPSDAWAAYWRDMPMIASYTESILSHESGSRTTSRRSASSRRSRSPSTNYPSWHPALLRRRAAAGRRMPRAQAPAVLPRPASSSTGTPSSAPLDASRRRRRYGYPVAMTVPEPRQELPAEGAQHQRLDDGGPARRRSSSTTPRSRSGSPRSCTSSTRT